MKKVLIITYYWPPSGGAGVQRWLKFSKYLPEFGWEPLILTIDPEYAAYPVKDDSLESDIPDSVRVFKTRSTDYFTIYRKDKTKIPSAGFAKNFDNSFKGKLLRFARGNFFIPDPRRGWNKYAFRKACEIIRDEGITHIVTTSPPHSTQLIGLSLKHHFPLLHWHCDLRDPWTDIYYYKKFYPTPISKSLDRYYEKSVLRQADSVTVTSTTQKTQYLSKVPSAVNKMFVVPNGYDEKDFAGIEKEKEDICTITYIGTLSDDYPLFGLLIALKTLREKGIIFKLRFTGLVTSDQKSRIVNGLGSDYVVLNEYTEHKEAIKMMVNSTFLLLIIPDVEGNKGVIPGKLFEYMATANPVICLGPDDCDAALIIKENNAGITINYSDDVRISQFLLDKVNSLTKNSAGTMKYSRYETTKQIAAIIGSN